MADVDTLVSGFEQHRGDLRAVAYRLLGSLADAEDAVQETWLRLASADASQVANLGGWLTTVVARVSLNMLRSRRHRYDAPVEDSWPGTAADPEEEAVIADSVGLALLVVLDTLSPAERVAFVLHDLFAMPFTEVAAVLERSPEATRQLASRARRRVRGAGTPSPDRAADLARQREVAGAFLAAARGGDVAALIALLDPDVTLTADATAGRSDTAQVLHGSKLVARGAAAAAARAPQSRLAMVNGAVGVVFAPAGRLQVALALTVGPDRLITTIDVIADPDRLGRLRLTLLPD